MGTTVSAQPITLRESFNKEIVRKGLHLLIGFLPLISHFSYQAAYFLLGAGSLIYTAAEIIRLNWNGSRNFFPYTLIRSATVYASRPGEAASFVIAPLTLAAGSAITLVLFPEKAMIIGILSLAAGDTAAALAGKFLLFRRTQELEKKGKTFMGSLACLLVTTVIAMIVSGDFMTAVAAGVTASVLEYCMPSFFDNLVVPVGTAAVVSLL